MNRMIIFVIFSVIFLSCNNNEKEVAGLYIKIPSRNTIDSLFLYADSLQLSKVYNRKVFKCKQRFYDKRTNKLLFENLSTWWINENGRIELDDLYLDTDNNPEDYSYSKEAIKNAVISSSLPISNNTIVVDEDQQVYYKKVK